MAAAALQHLTSLLEAHRLDRVVTIGRAAWAPGHPQPPRLATGIPSLDRSFGGWPCGAVSEVIGPRSSGRTTMLVATLAAATRRGDVVGLVDAFDRFHPRDAAAAGLDLDRMLWVRGPSLTFPARPTAVDTAIRHAVRACDLIIRAGNFGVVALDFADVPMRAVKALPFTTWLRLAHANERRDTVCLLVGDGPIGRSARGVSMRLASRPRWMGASQQSRRFAGFDVMPEIASATAPST